jgi:hypothetical protein
LPMGRTGRGLIYGGEESEQPRRDDCKHGGLCRSQHEVLAGSVGIKRPDVAHSFSLPTRHRVAVDSLASKMLRMSPTLLAFVQIRDIAKQIACPELGTRYRALSADAGLRTGCHRC